MGNFVIRTAVVGMYRTNCYVVYDDEKKEALIIDPGQGAEGIDRAINELNVKPVAVLITHGHLDHVGAMKYVKDVYNIPACFYKDEEDVIVNGRYNLSGMKFEVGSNDIRLEDGQKLELAGFKIRVIHTPGHTPGGCCYYFEEQKTLFAGDTLFFCSWGRTDFPGGSETALMQSIREKLLPLPEDTKVYPGHEGTTTIENERKVHGYR